MTNQSKVLKTLADLDIPFRIVEHPAVFTVAESMAHVEDKRPLKNLLLKEKGDGRMFLVIMHGEQRLDIKRIAEQLESKKLSFASADTLLKTLGVTPGAVSPFGLVNEESKQLEVVVEQSLAEAEELGFHPNDNTATVFICGEDLINFIHSSGHKLHLLHLI